MIDLNDFNLSDELGFAVQATAATVASGSFKMAAVGDKFFGFWTFDAVTGSVTGDFEIQTSPDNTNWTTLKTSGAFLLTVNGYVMILHKSQMPDGHLWARMRLVLVAGTSVGLSYVGLVEMEDKPDPTFHLIPAGGGWLQNDSNGNPRITVEASPEKND